MAVVNRIQLQPSHAVGPYPSHDAAQIEGNGLRARVLSYATGVIMPETRYALFVLGVGAGFFIAMYEWVTMIAEAMP